MENSDRTSTCVSKEARTAFYAEFDALYALTNGMDARIVLMDTNAAPGNDRASSPVLGPHGELRPDGVARA